MSTDPLDDLFIEKKPNNKATHFEQSVAWWKQYHVQFNLAMGVISLVVFSLISQSGNSDKISWFKDLGFNFLVSIFIVFYSNLVYLAGFLIDLLFTLGFKRPLIHHQRLLILGAVACFMLLCFFLMYSIASMPD